MKSSSSVVELVMLLCSQVSLASLSFLRALLQPDLSASPWGAVNPQSLIVPPSQPCLPFYIHWEWRIREVASLAANIGQKVKTGRPVRFTFDLCAGPGGWCRFDGALHWLTLSSQFSCGCFCCQVYLAAPGILNTNSGIISRCGRINDQGCRWITIEWLIVTQRCKANKASRLHKIKSTVPL